ncbi:unnamed protein product [Prunus brigantina]
MRNVHSCNSSNADRLSGPKPQNIHGLFCGLDGGRPKKLDPKEKEEQRNEFVMSLEVVKEDEEVYSWREVKLASIPELERETVERRRGRDIVIAVDHGPNSKHAFDWALIHFCRLADTIHLIHAVSSVNNEIVYDASQLLMQKLAIEAFEVAMVRTIARIVEGDPGKVICKEAERVKPAAVILGTRGRGFIQSVLQGSVSEYCMHNCKSAPVVIVPGKEAGDESLI